MRMNEIIVKYLAEIQDLIAFALTPFALILFLKYQINNLFKQNIC